jgi:hypothetical protein
MFVCSCECVYVCVREEKENVCELRKIRSEKTILVFYSGACEILPSTKEF